MFLIGLTGGIGSGKSTVARRFADHGVPVIDADAVARELVEPGEPTLDDLVERFGRGILREDGHLDRAGLAAIVFPDREARADLDRLTHPRIAARIAERVALLGAGGDDSPPLVLVDHPLLLETGQAGRFDAVVVVIVDEDERIRRLIDERGMGEADVRARIAAQTDDDHRRRVATHVITNDGTIADLHREVDRVYDRLLAAAAGR
jgi:dephospho-CoA kinase